MEKGIVKRLSNLITGEMWMVMLYDIHSGRNPKKEERNKG